MCGVVWCVVWFLLVLFVGWVCLFKKKTAYEMRISDWSADVGSSDRACAAQQVPLVLVEMAERRIEVGARDHAARIGKLREDGADHGGDFGVGAARAHLGEGKVLLFLLRVEPCG